MHNIEAEAISAASSALLELLTRELSKGERTVLGGGTGLPPGAIDCPRQNLVIAATPLIQSFYELALVRYGARSRRDVILVRHGFHPETLDAVRVDIALSARPQPIVVRDTSLFRHRDGSLHFAPGTPDLFCSIVASGLEAAMIAPWDTWDERSDGLTRAAAEVVRACRQRNG